MNGSQQNIIQVMKSRKIILFWHVECIRKQTVHKGLEEESKVKKECLVNVGFYEKTLFGWVFKKAVGKPGLLTCRRIKSTGGLL